MLKRAGLPFGLEDIIVSRIPSAFKVFEQGRQSTGLDAQL
jgi:hypothetical protein